MDKKIIAAIIAGAAVLVIIVAAAIGIGTGLFKFNTSGDSSEQSSSVSGGNASGSSSQSSGSQSEDAIQKGELKIPAASGSQSDTVKLPIKLDENPGIYAGQFYFVYDKNALEYIDYEKGDILDEFEVSDNDGVVGCIINGRELSDVTKNGTLITLEFKIKEDAPKGDYTIKLRDDSLVCNLDEKTVSPKIGEGKITVK